ncbi:MAG: transposase [Aestuariivita sp.]|nr:transposase [Aestuariivita sp.]
MNENFNIISRLQVVQSKSATVAQMLKAHGCGFLFLSAYSPDLNPIEMAFSKSKVHLRRIDARTLDQLTEATGKVYDLFTPEEYWNFFQAARYTS